MKLSKEVKTGILALGALLLLILGYSFLKGKNLFSNSRIFYVKYENVEGLAQAAPVTINGFTVGKVENISFANEKGWLIVRFMVDNDIEFSKNSVVRIYSAGLIGGKSLGIFPEYDAHNIARSGDTLRGEIEDSMLATVTKALGPLETKVNNTLGTLDSLLRNVNDVVDDSTRQNLKDAIGNLNTSLNSFSGITANLDRVLEDNTEKLDRTFTNLDHSLVNIKQLTDTLSEVEIQTLVADFQNVVSRIDNMVTEVDQGKGSVGKLLKDDELYNNLEGASRQLEELMQDIKLNPKRYVHFSLFGKRNKPYKKPEDPKL